MAENHDASRTQEFVVFALRGFGCLRSDIGVRAYGADLSATLKRQPGIGRGEMRRRGIRVPITNRAVDAMDEEQRGRESHG